MHPRGEDALARLEKHFESGKMRIAPKLAYTGEHKYYDCRHNVAHTHR